MPEYLSPGVYVEEIEIGAKPIEGVSTSTAGFIGETERGPTLPKLVTSWLEYQRKFGSYFGTDKYFPYALEGFFRNGGQRCYVARIVKKTAQSASLTLKADDNTAALTVNAIGEGSWGNNIAIKVSEGSLSGTFKLSVFYWKKPPSTLYDPDFDARSTPRPSIPVEVFDNLSVDDSSPNFFITRVNSTSNLINFPESSNTTAKIPGVVKGTASAGSTTSITLSSANTPNNLTEKGLWVNITDGTGAKQTRKIASYNAGTHVATVASEWKITPDNTSKYKLYWFQCMENGADAVELTGTAKEITTATKTTRIDLGDGASTDNDYYKDMTVRLLENTGAGQTRKIISYNGTTKIATIEEKWDTVPDGTSTYRIENKNPELKLADYERTDITIPGRKRGLTGIAEIDNISIIYSPNAIGVEGLGQALIDQCELLKDRFTIIDTPKASSNPTRQGSDTKYAAVYYPWINVVDPETGSLRTIPPGGHVAGIYARTDIERGVHKAPANETVRGADSTEFPVTKRAQDILNPQGINCIRAFSGRGIRVWGARTLSSDPLWKYINVRRLFLFLEESIEQGTQWVVFEPNDEKLWARVKQTITQFLNGIWKSGALMGTAPEEAFFVKCDRTTMTQDDIDNGRLIVIIGVAPVKPAEFVVFRIAQWQGGSSTKE